MSASQKSGMLNDAEHRRQLRRAVLASTIGTAIEWYDFFLYSTVTGLVFARLYFPRADPLVGTLEAFGVYAVGFLARVSMVFLGIHLPSTIASPILRSRKRASTPSVIHPR